MLKRFLFNCYRSIFPAVFLSILFHNAMPQPTHRIKEFTPQDGFEHPFIESMAQDGLGFLWLSGQIYLAKFDGHRLKYYLNSENDSLLQLGPAVGYLMTDETGNLWINNAAEGYHNNTLMQYDRGLDGFKKHKLAIRSYLNVISAEVGSSKIWLGTKPVAGHTPGKAPINKTGLYLFDTHTGELIHYLNSTDIGTPLHEHNNNIRTIENRGSSLVLGTRNGLWIFDKSTKTFRRPKVSDDRLITGWTTISGNGVIRWDTKTQLFVDSTFKVTLQIDLPRDIDGALCMLSDTSYFFSSDATTISKWKPATNTSEVIYHNSLDVYPSPFMDKHENVWVHGNAGLKKYQPSPIPFKSIPRPVLHDAMHIIKGTSYDLLVSAGTDNSISTMVLDRPHSGLMPFEFEGRESKWGSYVQLHEGRDYLWIGTWNRGVIGIPIDRETPALKSKGVKFFEHDPENPYTISMNHIRSIYEDEDGFLWAGTNSNGLCRINLNVPYGSKGSVERFMPDDTDSSAIRSKTVWSILPGSEKGSVWVAGDELEYFRDGVFTLKLKSDTDFVALIQSLSKDIYALGRFGLYVSRHVEGYKAFVKVTSTLNGTYPVEDKNGRLWLPEALGLRMYDPVTLQNRLFFDDAGTRFSFLATTRNGLIACGLGGSVLFFDPDDVKTDSAKVQPVLTWLEVNNKVPALAGRSSTDESFTVAADITVLDILTLDYRHNDFTIEFSAMEMSAPEKNRYRHKLDGYDEEWVETDYKSRTATYTNLDPGTYTFRVKACNHHSIWSDQERTLKVIILPPPWRTWWAYTSYSLLALGMLFVARKNIVQRERLKSNLQLAKVEQEKEHFELEKAKEVDRIKTSFFTNISHEFRTPLTLIKGPVQDMLERYKGDEKLQQQLKLVERNSDLLLKLINQLLDLAKLDSGNLKVEKSKGDVMRFIRASASSFTSLAAQKNISIHLEAPNEALYAFFDRDKLETILINLINNAIKFIPQNGIVAVNAETSSGWLLIKVKDTGIGIPADQTEKIFERFHQVSESHKEVGTGIGLALVKELVSLLGGTIAVKSEVGKGSEFSVTFPLEIVSCEDRIEAHEQEISIDQPTVHVVENKIALERAARNEDGTRPHILIIEDNADLRSFIIESLGEEFHFLEAENGKQGLDVATTEIPELIISDVMMPEMDGITMAEKIKSDIRTSHIPLILLTAKSTEASKLTGLESGADDYLTKPFNKHELLLKIRNGISRQRKLREKVMAELMSEAPRKEVLSADEQFLSKVKEEILKQMSDEQLSVESLAEQIGMSRVHLYRKISGLTGMSVNELIRKLRLHRAAQLLEQRWGPVSQVAYEVGFSNLSYFSKVFKEEFGLVPGEYLKTYSKPTTT